MTDFSKAVWQKSLRSQASGACVEMARVGDIIGMRDSKDPDGPILEFRLAEIAAFLGAVADGEFDALIAS